MKSLSFTKGDFFGGLTAGIVALPLALAFGVQSGLGAASGLYGAIFLGLLAAVLGGTSSADQWTNRADDGSDGCNH